jgi:RNA polymerase sigma-70 factor (ECF subfamily)
VADDDDLALARACANGDEQARRTFVERFTGDIDAVAARFARRIDRDDARQIVLSRLITGDDPKIGGYGGKGSLRGFVRAVATRALLNTLEKKTEDPLAESMLDALPAPDDPESRARHAQQRALLKAAFESAARSLSDRDRALMRYAVVEGANIDAIGALYGVHRATAARWLEAAREAFGKAMRRALAESGKLTDDEQRALHRSVEGQVELSVERVLA